MPAARRTISNHIDAMLHFGNFRHLNGVWMSIDIWHTSQGNEHPGIPMDAIRISMGCTDDIADGHAVKKWRLTYRHLKTGTSNPASPSVRWPTVSAGGERPASSLHATLRLDYDSCAMGTLLHMAPSKLDKKQCATLYVPAQPTTAAPASQPRCARLHASMAKGGQLLATAGVHVLVTAGVDTVTTGV